MGPYGQFCLDFYNIERRIPVNLPPGCALYPGMTVMPPGFGPGGYIAASHLMPASAPSSRRGQLGSWERNLGMQSIPEGEEKWSIPGGACIMLRREGRPDFTFQMPTRQIPVAVAQPQLGVL